MAALIEKSAPAAQQRSGAGHREVTPMPEQAYKRCTKCGALKPIDGFHRDRSQSDGREYQCKACKSAADKRRNSDPTVAERKVANARAWRQANKDRYNARRRARRKERPNVARDQERRYREANRERKREANRKASIVKRQRHPQKVKARAILNSAIAQGLIRRPDRCEDCGALPAETLHGHHHDYSKPLDVEWLCRICHEGRHHE